MNRESYTFERVGIPDLQQLTKQQIKRYIIENGLREGDRLPTEEELAHYLGTSRATIREALSGLEALGMIEVRHGSGRYVRSFNFSAILDNLAYSMLFDVHTLEEILDVRVTLEVSFLPRAISTLTSDDLVTLDMILRRLEEKGCTRVWDKSMMDDDFAFHYAIYQRIGNNLVLKLLEIFWTVHKNLYSRLAYETRDVPRYLRQHRAIYEAIVQRNAPLACQRLNEHFQGVREWITMEKAAESEDGGTGGSVCGGDGGEGRR